MSLREIDWPELKAIGVCLTVHQKAMFDTYAQVLTDWNARFNLTAIRNPREVRAKHFLDSLSCLPSLVDSPALRLVDVGTGAGFPGLPLKIALPDLRLTLVESVGKKAEFCRFVADKLNLSGVEVIQARAEDLGRSPQHRERYDCAVARAVAGLPVLAEYLLPLVRVGGMMLAQKGESGPAEALAAGHAIQVLGGRLRQVRPVQIPGVAEERYLVIVDKVAAGPQGYPRRAGIPAKKPL